MANFKLNNHCHEKRQVSYYVSVIRSNTWFSFCRSFRRFQRIKSNYLIRKNTIMSSTRFVNHAQLCTLEQMFLYRVSRWQHCSQLLSMQVCRSNCIKMDYVVDTMVENGLSHWEISMPVGRRELLALSVS